MCIYFFWCFLGWNMWYLNFGLLHAYNHFKSMALGRAIVLPEEDSSDAKIINMVWRQQPKILAYSPHTHAHTCLVLMAVQILTPLLEIVRYSTFPHVLMSGFVYGCYPVFNSHSQTWSTIERWTNCHCHLMSMLMLEKSRIPVSANYFCQQ